jgi:hypothetical protein
MTNREAIKELKLMRYNDANTGDMDRALEMAIEALSNNQNPSVSEVKTTADSVSEADVIYRADAIYHCRKRLYQTAEVNRPIEVYADIAENRIGEWLNELPSAHLVNDSQGFSQGDYISRQDAIDAIKTAEVNFTVRSDINFADYQKTVQDIFNNVLYAQEQVLKRLPSAQRTGEWIRWYEEIENDTCTEYIPHCKCSECGTEYDPHTVKFINFCTYCGADMRGDDNHDI